MTTAALIYAANPLATLTGTEKMFGDGVSDVTYGFLTQQIANLFKGTRGANLASSATPALGAASGTYLHMTGTTTITGFDSVAPGILKFVIFDGALTLTYHATNLNLPTAANIITVAGDVALFVSEGNGSGGTGSRWKCLGYWRASGAPLTAALYELVANKDTDTTLAANSDTKYPSQKAVKAYIDGLLAASNAVVYKGATDCSANPNYPAANAGDLYLVSVAGKIGGASGVVVQAGDMFICKTDGSASGDQATVGANWNVIQTNIAFTPEDTANKSTDGTFAANSDTLFPSQKAAKTYADTKGDKSTTNTWAQEQTFTVAPIFTDPEGSRDTLKIGPRWCFETTLDFTSSSFAQTVMNTEWARSISGTSATIGAAATLGGNIVGRARLELGTTSTGRAALVTRSGTMTPGNGKARFLLKGQLGSLSDATDTYVQRMGFMDDETAEPAHGAYWRYTHSVNGGKWECVCRKAGVETAVDSGVAAVAGGSDSVWDIRLNAAGTSVDFYIDDLTTPKASIATNVPTASLGMMVAAIRSAGTASKFAMTMDALYSRIDFTTPRW